MRAKLAKEEWNYMEQQHFDIIVLGGGPAGYCAAITAAQFGKEKGLTVALAEERQLGGTCLNRGCIPAKTFLEAAHTIEQFREAAQLGIEINGLGIAGTPAVNPSINLPKLFQYKNRIVKRFCAGVGVLLRENKIPVFTGRAVVGEKKDGQFIVKVSGKDNETKIITAKKVILATGSVPATLSFPQNENTAGKICPNKIWNSDTVYDTESPLKEIPATLAILGGGVIGIETARIFRSFGSDVVIIEAAERIIPVFDAEIADAVRNSLTEKKIKIITGQKLTEIKSDSPKADLTLCLENGETISASALLVAVGRVPNTAALSPELLAELNINRGIEVNDAMETNIAGLYAAGDVNGKYQLAHAAMEMGKIAAQNAVSALLTGKNAANFRSIIPSCIYGEPEAGSIGLTEEQAKEQFGSKNENGRIRIGRFPFAANGRAATAGVRSGFVKIISLDSKILGVHTAGPCASELINEASLAMSAGITSERWAETVHGHPSFGETLTEAAADCFGQCIHLPPR
ncbi:dihydrolipoyl dehydrogenase [Planctomycetales bacterium]|nr:dihydrolipoyl dehydrogenase [Planctomycetales bacterium]